MAYCRFSCCDFKSDVYTYEDVAGGYTTHVASIRYVTSEDMPPPIEDVSQSIVAWVEREKVVNAIIERSQRVPIGLPHDGQTISDGDAQACLSTLLMLRELGYLVPEHALIALREEIEDPQDNEHEHLTH